MHIWPQFFMPDTGSLFLDHYFCNHGIYPPREPGVTSGVGVTGRTLSYIDRAGDCFVALVNSVMGRATDTSCNWKSGSCLFALLLSDCILRNGCVCGGFVKGTHRFDTLDGMRGICALLIACSHFPAPFLAINGYCFVMLLYSRTFFGFKWVYFIISIS